MLQARRKAKAGNKNISQSRLLCCRFGLYPMYMVLGNKCYDILMCCKQHPSSKCSETKYMSYTYFQP